VLGSASASVSTTSGAVTATQLYSPYGAVRYASGILPTDIGFTHQRANTTTGLDDYGARWYDPLAGQFASADTTLAGGLNRYAYVAGNPETLTDPSGHLYAPPRNTSRSLAMWQSQNQPHTYYGSVKAFVTGLPQFLFGTDTLRQAFHTIFQDPKASLGDKAKALGAIVVTGGIDVVTVGSLFMGAPEVGADLRTFDEGLLAADDAKTAVAATDGVVASADEMASDATTATNADQPWYRGLRSDENPSDGLSPRNPNNRVSAIQHVRGGSRGSGDQFISFTKDPVVAVNKYAGGDPLRVVAVNPNGVTGTVYDLTSASVRRTVGMVPGTPAWNFAAADSEVLLEDGYVPPEAISPFSGGLW
jgi:RHS repeat-associated protein